MGPNRKQIIPTLIASFMFLCILSVQAIDIDRICPRMLHKVFNGYAPIGNRSAGEFKELPKATSMFQCAIQCCLKKSNCNVAFVLNDMCYHVSCNDDEQCLPMERVNMENNLKMVLVNPVSADSSWRELTLEKNIKSPYKSIDMPIDSSELNDVRLSEHIYPEPHSYNPYPSFLEKQLDDRSYGYPVYSNMDRYQTYDNDMIAEESNDSVLRAGQCTMTAKSCGENESCMELDSKSIIGVCHCNIGFTRDKYQKCVPESTLSYDQNNFDEKIMMINKELANGRENGVDNTKDDSSDGNDMVRPLTVSVVSKIVQLPDNKATLSAFPVPDEQTSLVPYNYSWSLISQPSGDVNGTTSDKTKSVIELTHLSEGLYRFKVVVSGKGWRGESLANITVLPEKRFNKSPQVIIKPAQQIIKAPTNSAILDGSASTDDDKIKVWRWDLIQGPINYAPLLTETSTLQLANLTLPGNYTFKLTVTDSDGITNSTTANITVLKATDYPPSANAGQPVILYLPQNNVTLDGSHSTDDQNITAWEWTKDPSDTSKAADMQDTRTPFLRLSNLEEGIYTFVLKVTDASNQSNTAKVSVFVKRPSNKPPDANAGINQTISLPQNWIVLNASNSTHDAKINSYKWVQLSGPTNSNILNKNAVEANATGLTIGTYVFEVRIIDDSNKNASSQVTITVVQEKNTPPVAHAGGDQSITLPQNAIYMNGTQSSDDLGIAKYEWTRDGTSLAIGSIVGKTNHEPVLIITNIVAGRYIFKLTVYDAQGLSSSDTVSVIVHPDPLKSNLVEITFTVGVSALTEAEVSSLQQKLVLLLGNNMKLIVRDLRIEQKTGEAILIFYIEQVTGAKENQIMNGFDVEVMLRDKLWSGSNIVGMPISDIRTTVCQNKCSNHGVCNADTRACMCDSFWMPNIYYFWGISEANCDWSILYVVIGGFIIFLLISATCWALTRFCRTSKPRNRPKSQKYSLVQSQDNENPSLNSTISMTDSDTDSDVLFENQKSNGILRNGSSKNGHKHYATTRLGRRIKAPTFNVVFEHGGKLDFVFGALILLLLSAGFKMVRWCCQRSQRIQAAAQHILNPASPLVITEITEQQPVPSQTLSIENCVAQEQRTPGPNKQFITLV